MKRQLSIWLLFGVCATVVLCAMGWTTFTLMELEQESLRRAVYEENVRLALWRLDSVIGPMIARENARPVGAYHAFYDIPDVWTHMFKQVNGMQVSPLLIEQTPFVKVYFQYGPDGTLTSPQVPTSNMRDIAEMRYTTSEYIMQCEATLGEFAALAPRAQLLRRVPEVSQSTVAWFDVERVNSRLALMQQDAFDNDNFANPYNVEQQRIKGAKELTKRAQAYGTNTAQYGNVGRGQQLEEQQQQHLEQSATINAPAQQAATAQPQGEAASLPVQAMSHQSAAADDMQEASAAEAMMRPVWIEGELLLVRRVGMAGGEQYLQGAWLNWSAMRVWLLDEVRDLLPEADLQPVMNENFNHETRMLATLPIKLVPGAVTLPAGAMGLTPQRITLLIAWAMVFVAVLAGAVLLRGVMSLSERRGAFVSAVTHELRTPLTTFRMYTEMLRDGMVRDKADRQQYLTTLSSESERLQHLIENVLAYSRLERGSARGRTETMTVRDLLGRISERLRRRSTQAGFEIDESLPADVAQMQVATDASAVEQIVFNLVDNACKYAAMARDRRIHLAAERRNGYVVVSVQDHGPGIAGADRGRLFQPFSKSVHEAASTAPGVGLGLALSRRLARSLHGDLSYCDVEKGGACFRLSLPAANA